MTPEVRWLNTEQQFDQARRTLLAMGFCEQSSTSGPGMRACVLLAPDGYAVRLSYSEKANGAS